MSGADYLAECEALAAFVDTLGARDFLRHTTFYDWTVADEVMHLHFLDEMALNAIEQEEAFCAEVAMIRRRQEEGEELSELVRRRLGHLDRDELVRAWRGTYRRLAMTFAARNPKQRMKWFGPDMSLVSAASARQMEVWAHGQDIYDLFGVRRESDDRIRNTCELGVRTFGWTFVNRGLEPPPAPSVTLIAPSGARWHWNAQMPGRVFGSAEDFAAVVTQRRHIDDTGLETVGAGARRWMELAQCFAGAPSDGPPSVTAHADHE